jgi:hypothetical protein
MSNPISLFFKWMFVPDIENKLPVIRGAALEPRAMPAGAKIHYQGEDGIKVSVPGYRRKLVLWGALFAAILFFVMLPTLVFGTSNTWIGRSGRVYHEQNWFLSIFLVGAIPGFCIWAFRFLKPRVVITARDNRVRVAGGNSEGLVFDTVHYSGMRKGFEMKSGKVKDQAGLGLFTGLRVGYGEWGEETPFMFQKMRGLEYILWMNSMIEPVVIGGAVHESEIGERKQSF